MSYFAKVLNLLIRQSFPPPPFYAIRYGILSMHRMKYSVMYILIYFQKSSDMLNKNTLGVKKCEANQKQH